MRHLATIRRISDIKPIPNADAIECAMIDGWQVVVKKGEFNVGDFAVYLEIDSWVPHSLAPFLTKGDAPKEFEGIPGNRLRTVKLRGQISQGLLLPTSVLSPDTVQAVQEGANLDELLNIKKFEPPVSAQLAGQVQGCFPGFIQKTDQERVQNLWAEFEQWKNDGIKWEVTEKLDGSSMTVYIYNEAQGVCSRNLELKEDVHNTFWATAIRQDLIGSLRKIGRNLALQGELCGPGIQGNKYNLDKHVFCLFDIYDIDAGQYLAPLERQALSDSFGIAHVPLMHPYEELVAITELMGWNNSQSILDAAEGDSLMAIGKRVEREGLVFKSADGQLSFKAISNKFLLKEG